MSGNTAPIVGRSPDYQIVIVDDHEMFSTSLTIALRDRGIEAQRVSVEHLQDFAARPRGERLGVVVLDLNLGEAPDGRRIKGHDWVAPLNASGWPVLVVTGGNREADIAAAIAEGAVGVLSKASALDVLLEAVMRTVQGEPLITETERSDWESKHRIRSARRRQLGEKLSELTSREREVLDEIARGQHAADIAKSSIVSLTTVRTQIRSILRKLEVSSQIEAVALLRRHTEDS